MLKRAPLAVFALVFAACAPSPAGDVPGLRAAQKADEAVAVELRKVDELATTKGRARDAVAALDTKVLPAVDQAEKLVAATKPSSKWGQAQRAELAEIVALRRRAAGRYKDALESDDLTKVVEALEEQKALEQRSARAAAALGRPPEGGCSD